MDFAQAFLVTNLIEIPVAYFFLRKTEDAKRVVSFVFLLNVFTLPFVWFAFPKFGLSYWQFLIFSELFAFSIEIYMYSILFAKTDARVSAAAALCANLASFLAGIPL